MVPAASAQSMSEVRTAVTRALPILERSAAEFVAKDFGFTPLIYAATIDFGDAEALKALLKAGADRTTRNYDGRTALDQARRYKHSHLEASLR
ncbi:MAG: hypothetical protein DMG11_13975 [Acidobacteria bacterium]|nr:MAG: hypothetical protein DMG11_13975 [Acidobacteriota bacterium]